MQPLRWRLLSCPASCLHRRWRTPQDEKPSAHSAPTDKAPEAAPPDSTTQGALDATARRISLYTAVAGTITVGATDAEDAQLGTDGKPQPGSQLALSAPKDPADAPPVARMFYVAYFKKDAKAEERPITFFYNGGPGSSTVWLHMGSLGPKDVSHRRRHSTCPRRPTSWSTIAYSLLDVSDLVFIDMPGTGFGRLIGKDAGKAFWGVDEDADAFARFIARFSPSTTAGTRPNIIFGESYGTTRSAVLANMLENDKNIDLNGVILLSQIFNFTIVHRRCETANPGMDLPYELALPTFAATAWYHKKLPQQPPALEPFLKEVEDFAMGAYAHALAQGTDLSDAEKQAVAEKLHEYTGLPVAYLIKANLRVKGGEFEKTFRR